MDEKKENKKVQPYSLKPINIQWINEQALRLSTPDNKISSSLFLDRLIDEARLKDEAQSPSPVEKKSALASAREMIPA
jgi:hypothetical protein